jgi:NADP+-dependent farnesol dehydrogenase
VSTVLKGGVVLGASSGVGHRLARRLAAGGQQITAVARRAPELDEGVAAVSADVRDYAGLERVIRSAKDRQAVDYIVNCVGVGFYAPVGADYLRAWTDILTTNVASLLSLLSIIDTHCADLPVFVQVSSMAAHRPSRTPGNLCYSASKAAARVIVEEYRKQVRAAGRRTRVSMVSPGFVEETDFGRNFYAHAPAGVARADLYGAHENLTADDVAAAIAHLLHTPERVEILDLIVCARDQPA